MDIGLIIFVVFFAFLCEYLDSTLGMGYGTIMSPVFLILGFKPQEIVFAILVSEFLTGILAGFFHHHQGNVDFKINTQQLNINFRKRFSLDLKVVMVLLITSITGAVTAVVLVGYLPPRVG
ncbi:MAG: TSUP family transporter [Candidatus Omnitrophica bacterium]|nr:TSUP family transporter [Candidatus Omnitrophota bacterium]